VRGRGARGVPVELVMLIGELFNVARSTVYRAINRAAVG